MANQIVDPWRLDASGQPDPFDNVNFNMPDLPDLDDGPSLEIHPNLNPEIVTTPVVEPVVPPEPVAPVEPEGPETYDVEDGTVTLEKDKGQWKATLINSTGGGPQVYWGKNKNDLLVNVMKAQLNATKKIRELNAKVKFGTAPVTKPKEADAPTLTRSLSTDEKFELKTLFESDPEAAFELMLQKKTGRSLAQIVSSSDKGEEASLEMRADTTNRSFLARNPEYYGDPGFKNFTMMIKWLAKFKLGKIANDQNADQIFMELVATENYTVENLEEAFQDLTNDGLLEQAPRASRTPSRTPANEVSRTEETPAATPPPPVVVQNVEPAQPAPRPDSRIVKTETRPRAGFGLRTSDVTPVAPPDEKPPSVEDFESMSDDQIKNLLFQVKRTRAQDRRS